MTSDISPRNEYPLLTLKVHVWQLKDRGLIKGTESVFQTIPLESNYTIENEMVNEERRCNLYSVNYDFAPSNTELTWHLKVRDANPRCKLRLSTQQLRDLHLLDQEPLY